MWTNASERPLVHVVDDDKSTQHLLGRMFASVGLSVSNHWSAEEFLAAYEDGGDQARCLVLDFQLPGLTGLELQQKLRESETVIPIIMCTGNGGVAMAVRALQNGAVGFVEKPIDRLPMLQCVENALATDAQNRTVRQCQTDFLAKINTLSRKELEVMELMIDAYSMKEIAARLGIGFQTAAKHHAHVLRKLEVKNDAALVAQVNALGRKASGIKRPAPSERGLQS